MVAIPIGVYELCTEGTPQPDLGAIADFLRSSDELTPEVRCWLATLFDRQNQTSYRLELKSPRGRKPAPILPHLKAVFSFFAEEERLQNIHRAPRRKEALFTTMSEYKIGRSTLEDAIKTYFDAQQENFRISNEEASPPNDPA